MSVVSFIAFINFIRRAWFLARRLAGWLAGCRLASAGATVASWFLVCGVRPAGQLGLGLWPAGRPAGAWFVAGRPAGQLVLGFWPAGRPAGWLGVK